MSNKKIVHLHTITEFHRSRGLKPPKHPLISVVNYADLTYESDFERVNWVFHFFSIAVKRNLNAKIQYGQTTYDFDEGVMYFMAPGQVLGVATAVVEAWEKSGWILLIHPDFLWSTTLAGKIKNYDYFDYAVNEALHLSESEELTLQGIINHIELECHNSIDKFSQQIIISQIETLLSYADRFYQRQFHTRKISNHEILSKLELILNEYFSKEVSLNQGLPSVQYLAEKLNLTPNYLSGLLKTLTGQGTQQHIHQYLIEKAKEQLSTTNLSVSEIAYSLGFEHPQSFAKLFKSKTNSSPVAFRAKFN